MEYETQRKLIVVFILTVIVVVIMTLVALVFIWLPDNNIEEDEKFTVGKIERQETTEEAVVEKYYKQLYVLVINNDLDAICDLVGQDYLEYFELEEQDIIDFLREKSILTKGLELVQYKSFYLDGYSNVYEFDLKAKDEAYAINIVVREKSPNNYTIAFDKFIDCTKDTYTATKDSVKLDIYKTVRYTNSVQYELKLTNYYNKNIKLNTNLSATPIILVNSQSEVRKPIFTTMSAIEVELEPNQTRAFTAVFDVEDEYDYFTYNTLVIKDSQFEGIQGADNLEFTLN